MATKKVITEEELALNDAKLAESNKRLIHEINARKRAENKLDEFEKSLIDVLENEPLGVAIVSADYSKLLYANRQCLDIYGYESIEELLATPRKKRSNLDNYTLVLNLRRQGKQIRGQPVSKCFNVDILRKDGETRHVAVHAGKVLWDDQKCYMMVIEDITEHVRDKEALREDEAFLALLLNQIPCGIWTMDSELRFTASSRVEMAGLAPVPAPTTGMDIYESLQTEDAGHPAIAAHLQALKGKSVNYEFEWKGKILNCRVEPLRNMSGHIIGVISVAFDITDVRNTESQLMACTHRLIQVQEEERRIMARELHDELGQSLTALQLMLARVAQTNHETTPAVHDEAQALVRDMISKVRQLSFDLGSTMLDDLGLLPTLLQYFKRQNALTGLKINFNHTGLVKTKIPAMVRNAAYRIIQESVTNVIRHAGVDSVNVRVWVDHRILNISIEDKGNGFDPAKLVIGQSCGLQGIQDRVRLLDGKLEIESAPGRGTRLIAELPLPGKSGNQEKSK